MADTNNPGQVSVEGEVYGNPNPNGGSSLLVPEQLDDLTEASAQGYPPAANGVDAQVFPTPTNVTITQVPTGQQVNSSPVPNAAEVVVDDQVIGRGVWLPVDPMNPAAGKRFVSPGEFLVVGPDESIQTNEAEATRVLYTITAVYDADNLWQPPVPTTTRFLLAVNVVANPPLTSYPVSILGRQIIFADDTTTAEIAGAVRRITAFNTNFVVIDSSNPEDSDTPELVININPPSPPNPPIYVYPSVTDTFWVEVQREGAQDISRTGDSTVDVIIAPPPSPFVPNPSQALGSEGTIDIAFAPQPNQPIITSGVAAPTAVNVQVADQATSIGLPVNVNI